MIRPFRTPTQALIADIACWVSLIALIVYAAVTVSNPVVTGVLLTVGVLIGLFALVYNGSNTGTVVRSYISRKRYEREESKRQAEYAAERERQNERDASYGRELRDLNRRHNRDY